MVYGDFVDGTKEDASTKPKNIYGEAKLTGERMVKLFAKRDGLNYNIIRPSGVYGPGDMPDRVVSKFFAKAMKNETITLHNGENKVDFTYRQDAAKGIILSALSSVANVSFNITAGNATSLRTLANTIIAITNSQSEVEDIGNHDLYPMRGTLDISRAKDLIEYEPQYELKEGLEKYYVELAREIKGHLSNAKILYGGKRKVQRGDMDHFQYVDGVFMGRSTEMLKDYVAGNDMSKYIQNPEFPNLWTNHNYDYDRHDDYDQNEDEK